MMGKRSPTSSSSSSSSSSSNWSSTSKINSNYYNNSNKRHHDQLQHLSSTSTRPSSHRILKTNVYSININSSCSTRRGSSYSRSSSSSSIERGDLGTDLKLGHPPPPDTVTTNSSSSSSSCGHQYWSLESPPRSAVRLKGAYATKVLSDGDDDNMKLRRTTMRSCPNFNNDTLFVKVYLDGNGIGRKLDLFALRGYHHLSILLSYLFNLPNNIQCK